MKLYSPLIIALLVLSVNSTNAQCIIAEYPFDGNAMDQSGNSYDGVVIGAILTTGATGKPNSAYDFDGSGDQIILNNDSAIISSAEFTIAAWAKMDGIGGGASGQNPIFSQRDDDASSSAKSTVSLFAEDATGNTHFLIRSSINTGGAAIKIQVARQSYGEWHHYAAVLDLNNIMRLYIDGVEVDTIVYTQTGDFTTSIDHVGIGVHTYSGTDKGLFNGQIDEVNIYNCALSSTEIQQLADATPWTTGMEGNMGRSSLKIYPNPAGNMFFVEGNSTRNYKVIVCDVSGKIVLQAYKQREINISELDKGLYLVKVYSEDGDILKTEKLLKQ